MRIQRNHIENFSSIRCLNFEPGPYCVLIGENNAGKSNLLRALNLVLGESWPSERWNRETEGVTCNDVLFWMHPDFEAEDGLTRDDAEELDGALAHFHEVKESDIPAPLADALRVTVNLLP